MTFLDFVRKKKCPRYTALNRVSQCLVGHCFPLVDRPNLKFFDTATKSEYHSSMCFHAWESTTDHITSSSESLFWCHFRSFEIAADLYILFNLGMSGKCRGNLASIVLDMGMYRDFLQNSFGRWWGSCIIHSYTILSQKVNNVKCRRRVQVFELSS